MIVYRHATFGTPLRTEPARQPGRFHEEEQAEPTQYLCLHPLGPLAELMRGHCLRLAEQIRCVRARTWALRLSHDELSRSRSTTAHEHGLKPPTSLPTTRPLPPARRRAARCGAPGVVAPSAALPGTRNVVLFGQRVGSPYLLEPLGEVDVPASITAHAGRPVVGLIEPVRYRGEPHAGLRPGSVARPWFRGARLEPRRGVADS